MIKEDFNKYMEEFKKKSLEEKQDITISQLKMIVGLVKTMCEANNIESDMLFNRELIDVNDKEYTQDDFVESLIVYVNSIQNMLCDYNIQNNKNN